MYTKDTAKQRDNREGTTVVPNGIFGPVWFGLWLHISTEGAEQEDSQLLAYFDRREKWLQKKCCYNTKCRSHTKLYQTRSWKVEWISLGYSEQYLVVEFRHFYKMKPNQM
jgi:hypothetical protein